MNRPTLVQLRALVALADTLHFGEAASRLGVSQPTVSGAVRGLEASLGVKLAERSSRKVVLTAAGAETVARARHVLDEVESMAEAAAGTQTAANERLLRLGVIPTVAPYILAPLLRALARWAPRLRPEITEDQTARLLDELVSGRLDALVLALPAGCADIVETPLYREDFVLLVPPQHPLAGKLGLGPEVLKGLRLLLLEEGHCLSSQALEVCRQAGAATNHPARAASLTTIAQLVAAGLGATLLPATALPVETRKGRVAVAQFRAPAPGRQIGLVWRARSDRDSEYRQVAGYVRRGLNRPGFAGRVIGTGPLS
jgi:LysR family hydrogen peroxide-inducible transcriptional activator